MVESKELKLLTFNCGIIEVILYCNLVVKEEKIVVPFIRVYQNKLICPSRSIVSSKTAYKRGSHEKELMRSLASLNLMNNS